MNLEQFNWLREVKVDADSTATLPAKESIFKALELTSLRDTKVVILGQDPYPSRENATGLAFSVPPSQPIPPSLRNIFLELMADVGCDFPSSGDLTPWAKQGVLLLNKVLTVEEGKSGSHVGLGWEEVTSEILRSVLEWGGPKVVICWGKNSQEGIGSLPVSDQVLFLSGGHPSPRNRSKTSPFRGGRYFSKANAWLEAHGVAPIDWRLP